YDGVGGVSFAFQFQPCCYAGTGSGIAGALLAACFHSVLTAISSQSRSKCLANFGVYFALNDAGALSGSDVSAIAVALGMTVSKGSGRRLYGSILRLLFSTMARWT